jgi:hypothetical protein
MAVTRPSGSEHGQATVELVALLPLMGVLAALLWQAVWFVGSAPHPSARASALDTDASAAARRVLPDRLERGLVVRRGSGSRGVQVAIAVPAVLGSGRLTTVRARARLQDQAP